MRNNEDLNERFGLSGLKLLINHFCHKETSLFHFMVRVTSSSKGGKELRKCGQ